MRKRYIGALAVAASLVVPAFASAHVTLQPKEVPAGSFVRLDVRVPNEQDDAATDEVEIKLPDGFVFASYEPAAGWRVDVRREKLDEPIEAEGGPIDEQVSTITWRATDRSAAIQPGQFRDFGLSVGLPEADQAGDVLTFGSIQTYDNGDVVRWIGSPDSEQPAPQVTLTAAEDEHAMAAEEVATADESDGSDSGAPTWLAVLALVVGAGGLLSGGLALRGRRSA